MFAVDIVSFSSRRDPSVQRHLRGVIHRIVRDSCNAFALCWENSHIEDRGDGLFVIADPGTSVENLLGPLVSQLLAGVHEHNKLSSSAARIRLRVAVHAGYVHIDDHGATGLALIHLFRLLDAPRFRAALAMSLSDLGLIVSNYLYEEVVVFSPGLVQAAAFQPVEVRLKETHGHGWVWLPPVYPSANGPEHAALAVGRTSDAVVALAGELADDLLVSGHHEVVQRDRVAALLIAMAHRLKEISRTDEQTPG